MVVVGITEVADCPLNVYIESVRDAYIGTFVNYLGAILFQHLVGYDLF